MADIRSRSFNAVEMTDAVMQAVPQPATSAQHRRTASSLVSMTMLRSNSHDFALVEGTSLRRSAARRSW
jgi:hypothetical protein